MGRIYFHISDEKVALELNKHNETTNLNINSIYKTDIEDFIKLINFIFIFADDFVEYHSPVSDGFFIPIVCGETAKEVDAEISTFGAQPETVENYSFEIPEHLKS
tara:strand:- start:84 stop:398 length:315 start_codon:yes stop_codon:yes gene_type:complete